MKLGLLTAIWGRPKLAELMLGHAGQQGFYLPLAIYSAEEDAAGTAMVHSIINHTAWDFMSHANQPLADKWLAGVGQLRVLDFDAVMILGSDDFVTPEYVRKCVRLLEGGADLILPRHIHYFDTASQRAMKVRHHRPGAGRVLSRSLLEKLNWEPWRAGDANIDGSMDKRIKESAPGTVYTFTDRGIVLDVKTDQNMWGYDYLRKGEFEDLDAESFLNKQFPSIANQLLNWNE